MQKRNNNPLELKVGSESESKRPAPFRRDVEDEEEARLSDTVVAEDRNNEEALTVEAESDEPEMMVDADEENTDTVDTGTETDVDMEPEADMDAAEDAIHTTEDAWPDSTEDTVKSEPISQEDVKMALRFSLTGKVSRKCRFVRISDVLYRTIKEMYPDQRPNKTLENALLTRIFLEDRDAFDTMDIIIEDKGGHIKC